MQIIIVRMAMTTSSGWCSAFYHLGGATGSPLVASHDARGSNYAPQNCTMGSLPLALVARRLPNSIPVRWGISELHVLNGR